MCRPSFIGGSDVKFHVLIDSLKRFEKIKYGLCTKTGI